MKLTWDILTQEIYKYNPCKKPGDMEPQDPISLFCDDSLDRIDLFLQIEECFKVSITDAQAEKFETLGDINLHIGLERGNTWAMEKF